MYTLSWMTGNLTLNAANDFNARVIHIADSTQLLVEVNGRKLRVQIAHITAPGELQHAGRQTKKFLGNWLFGQTVHIEPLHWITDDTLTARVLSQQNDVARVLLQRGLAWVDPRSDQYDRLKPIETQAYQARRGLWQSHRLHPPPRRSKNKEP